MFDLLAYLDLPEEPNNCIYEDCRNKILLNPEIFIHLLKYNYKEEMKNIHTLHICLYDKYGEDWADKINFIDEQLRNAVKLLYVKDYAGKELINKKKKEKRELLKKVVVQQSNE